MRWSKLRHIVESRLAPCLAGRLRLESTHYARAHDAEGRWGVVIDGEQVWGMGCIIGDREQWALEQEIRAETGLSGREARQLAMKQRLGQARHNQDQFHSAVWDFTQMSIADALASDDAVIRSLAYLDARTGKRRLLRLASVEPGSQLERACLGARLCAEGISFHWAPQDPVS